MNESRFRSVVRSSVDEHPTALGRTRIIVACEFADLSLRGSYALDLRLLFERLTASWDRTYGCRWDCVGAIGVNRLCEWETYALGRIWDILGLGSRVLVRVGGPNHAGSGTSHRLLEQDQGGQSRIFRRTRD